MAKTIPMRWQTLADTPKTVDALKGQHAEINGCSLYYAMGGTGEETVILLHGGMANSDYWGIQAAFLIQYYRVIVVDSRAHGRSSAGDKPLSYNQMTHDIASLMDHLGIAKASIVGWSDGGIQSIMLAALFPEKITRIFAYGAHMSLAGLNQNFGGNKVVSSFLERAEEEYHRLSPTPDNFDQFYENVQQLWKWKHDSAFTIDQLSSIRCPAWIVDGDRDEMINRSHLEYLFQHIPDSSFMLLPDTTHFAFIQAPNLFNAALQDFMSVSG
ncbi:MAG: alpha/beta hydrolase [Zymomonas mobilis]|uniref:alpha/beta fold hydrolase n=1 Tax=Zymomonas mobilis TaxID=542 RepID=UPI0039EB7751